MPRILIIADDLTGAADCAAACGGNAVVELGLPDGSAGDADVFAIDADTRCMAPAQAATTIRNIVRICDAGRATQPGVLFKKVDSTLRGHVGAELAAVLEERRLHSAWPDRIVILFAPAFPAQGRTTIQGRQMVQGQMLEHPGSEAEKDSCSDIAGLLAGSGLACGLLGREMVRSGARALEEAMRQRADEVDVIVCDAETDSDLEAIAEAGRRLGPKTIWAGSAGLARHLPCAAEPAPTRAEAFEPRDAWADVWGEIHGPTLFVVGSYAAASREQARALRDAPGVVSFTVWHDELLSEDECTAWREQAQLIAEKLQQGTDVMVQLDSSERCESRQAGLLTRSLARLIAPCSEHAGALVATGGETARAILDAWGIRRLRLLGEIEPGLPYSVVEGWKRSLMVITKAGGFGTSESLLRARDFVRGRSVSVNLRRIASQDQSHKS